MLVNKRKHFLETRLRKRGDSHRVCFTALTYVDKSAVSIIKGPPQYVSYVGESSTVKRALPILDNYLIIIVSRVFCTIGECHF